MLRPVALVALVTLAGCPRPVLDASTWSNAAPNAPCEVDVLYHDGMGDSHRTERYDVAGHVLWGTIQLTYDGGGFERVTWNAGRPSAFDTFIEQNARAGGCESAGGCDEPASRRIERVELEYDGERLASLGHSARDYHDERGRWVEVQHAHGRDRYRYAAGRLVEIDAGRASVANTVNGTVHLDYNGDHVVRRRFEQFRSAFEWQDGRLAVDRWSKYVQSYRYDTAGRLIGEVIADQSSGGETTTNTWTYDDHGRLVEKLQSERYGNGATSENRWTWTYDDHGRVVRTTNGGGFTERNYRGHCADGVAAPNPPDALQLSGAAVCLTSPGYLYDSCGY